MTLSELVSLVIDEAQPPRLVGSKPYQISLSFTELEESANSSGGRMIELLFKLYQRIPSRQRYPSSHTDTLSLFAEPEELINTWKHLSIYHVYRTGPRVHFRGLRSEIDKVAVLLKQVRSHRAVENCCRKSRRKQEMNKCM